MEVVNVGDVVVQLIVFILILIFFVSLTLFIRRLLISQRKQVHETAKIEQKLDKIIELLEQDKLNK